MQSETFHLSSYISAHEAFHYARKNLARRYPRNAHDHDFFEVFLIVEGRTAHWINGVTQVLEPGQLVFMRPTDTHAFRADQAQGCEIINIMFRVESAEHLIKRYADSLAGRFFASKSDIPELHTLGPTRFKRALNVATQLQTADRSLARIEEFLLALINRVAVPETRAIRTAPRWFSAACNAAQHPEVFRDGAAGFIAAAGRSHEHVCRTCKDVLGVTPTDYINRIRIDHAAQLLRTEDSSIETIAAACGFQNTSYFYRLFDRAFQTTPRRYRFDHQRDPFDATHRS
ncbi:AraC family transcriptional regulator [Marivita sp. S6314]|uniref:AraC family transcriptional regulator n=1 Tax=Marivita sp. S6314 TaxID=2926406 RepID=UPI001FF5BB11|nr:AraC family transcriptional regulator [Marivita sp. S6314]MCK0149175.1 AraC family transcriptional regulator [Marivita sp. S6314]